MKLIYEIENREGVYQYMDKMKVIMVRGVGYFVISKDIKMNADLLLRIACSMENKNINI